MNRTLFENVRSWSFKMWALVAISLLAEAVVLTDGTLDFHATEKFGSIYTSMLDHMKKGEADVSGLGIETEYATRNGKFYTYFGPLPALVRGLIELFFQRSDRDWSRWSCFLASALASVSVLLIFTDTRRRRKTTDRPGYGLPVMCYLGVLFSGVFLGLLSCAYIFHEAILWGLAWNLIFLKVFLDCLMEKRFSARALLLLALAAGLSSFARMTMAEAPFLALVALMVGRKKLVGPLIQLPDWKATVPVFLLFGAIGAAHLGLNQMRWGDPLEFWPYKNYWSAQHDPARLQRAETYGKFKLDRAPLAFEYYLLPHAENFSKKFPFIKLRATTDDFHFNALEYSFDYIENTASPLLLNSFFLTGTAIFGAVLTPLVVALEGPALSMLTLAYLAAGLLYLFLPALAIRYEAEFVPLFTLLARNVIVYFSAIIPLGPARRIKRWQVGMLLGLSLCLSIATILRFKADFWAGPASTHARLLGLFASANHFLHIAGQ